MRRSQGLAVVLAVAALAGGGAVAAASSSGKVDNGPTTPTTTTGTTGTTGTTTAPTTPPRMHRGFAIPGGFAGPRGFAVPSLQFFDAATRTALKETFAAVQTAQKTASDAGKSPDDIRDAAIAAAKARLDQAVTDDALTKGQAAAVLAALTKLVGARAAVIDAAAAVLKLTPTDLAKQLAAGGRLDAIAKTQGVALKDVLTAIQTAAKAQGGGGLGLGFGFGGGFGFGFGGGFGFGFGFGGKSGILGPHLRGHRGFGGPGQWKGKPGSVPPPPPATMTQPSTQNGSRLVTPQHSNHI
jgi:hypothetical protein